MRRTSLHFQHQPERLAELVMDEAADIAKNHHLNCTNQLTIGEFSIIAGYNYQFLTHSINVMDGRPDSVPIHIGPYTFIETNVVVLGGAVLLAYPVQGANSLLNRLHTAEWMLYEEVPAKPVSGIPRTAKCFRRTEGFVC